MDHREIRGPNYFGVLIRGSWAEKFAREAGFAERVDQWVMPVLEEVDRIEKNLAGSLRDTALPELSRCPRRYIGLVQHGRRSILVALLEPPVGSDVVTASLAAAGEGRPMGYLLCDSETGSMAAPGLVRSTPPPATAP